MIGITGGAQKTKFQAILTPQKSPAPIKTQVPVTERVCFKKQMLPHFLKHKL
jgi:hypothetical protein